MSESRFLPGRWVRIRTYGVVGLIGACFCMLSYRAWVLQVRESERLKSMAEDQYLRDVEIPPRRGRILDRNDVELAASVEIDSLACNQRVVAERAGELAGKLAAVLHLDRRELEKRLRGKKYFSWVKRRLDPDEARAMREQMVPGLSIVREPRRYYPHRDLAGPLLGFAGLDAVGQEGLELQHDRSLRGARTQVPGLRDALGRAVLIGGLADAPASAGQDVETTIDRHLQFRLDQALARAVGTHHAKAGAAVAIDPRNGEVLAVSSVPTFNPNDPGDAHEKGARLGAVTDPFEPGSTMKTISIAGALEAGLTNPDEPFYCENGSYKVGPATIHDAERIGDTTLTGVLAMSSNICTAKIAARQGKERLRETLVRFGFGKPTGVDLPGERGGSIRPLAKMGPVETATTSFGQGMTATPLQLAAAYAAIANGGTLYRPHVSRRVLDGDGRVVSVTVPEGHRVIDEKLAATLRGMLFAVSQKGGTAQKLSIPGYHFGGKTGTAQKVDPATRQYSSEKWASSFVGFAPIEDPRLVVYVMVDEPQGGHHGSTVAGPVFQEVMIDAMRWLAIVPTEPIKAEPQRAEPRNGAPIAEKNAPLAPVEPTTASPEEGMPDLRGLGVREAVARAMKSGVRVEVVGSGVAVEQSLPPGSAVEGALVKLTFRPPG
jgi:cell division protein FtsI (penicillin-binding protein 3)